RTPAALRDPGVEAVNGAVVDAGAHGIAVAPSQVDLPRWRLEMSDVAPLGDADLQERVAARILDASRRAAVREALRRRRRRGVVVTAELLERRLFLLGRNARRDIGGLRLRGPGHAGRGDR